MLHFSPTFAPLILALHILSLLLLVPTSFLYLRLRIPFVAYFGIPLFIFHFTSAASLALYDPAMATATSPKVCLLRVFFMVWSSRSMCWLVGFFAIRLWIVVTQTRSHYLKFNIGAWLRNLAMALPLVPALLATVPQLFRDLEITDPTLQQCNLGFMAPWQSDATGWPWFLVPAMLTTYASVSIICHYAFSRSLILHMLLMHIRTASISIRVLLGSLFSAILVMFLFFNDIVLRARTPRLIHGIDYLDGDDVVASLYGTFYFLILGTTLQGWRSVRHGTRPDSQLLERGILMTVDREETRESDKIDLSDKILMKDTGRPEAVVEQPPRDASRLQPLGDALLAFTPPPLSPRIIRPQTPSRIETVLESESKPVLLASALKRSSINSNSSQRFTLTPISMRKSRHSSDFRISAEISDVESARSGGRVDSIAMQPSETFGEGFFDWKRKISLAAVGGPNKAALAKARRSMLGLEPEGSLPSRKPPPVDLPPPIPRAFQP